MSKALDCSFLYSWQKDVIKTVLEDSSTGRYYAIKSFRQMAGKTFTLLNLLGIISIIRPGSVSMLISPTFKQSQRCLEDLGNAYIDWVKLASKGNGLIDFNNGSRIYFNSAEQGNALRGYTVKKGGVLCIDEASFIPNEIFEILFPIVNKKKASVILASTPDRMTGMFYDLYTKGLQNDSKILSFNWSKYINQLYTQEELDFYRSIYSSRRFTTEILGDFVVDGGSVFQNIGNCILSDPINYQEDIYFGIDWGSGSGNDYTVVTALDSNKNMIFQKAFNDLAPLDQIEYIIKLIKEHNPRKVLVEKNSIGSVYYDMLRRGTNCNIESFITNNDSKCRIIDQLCAAFEKGQIGILNDEELLTQLKGFEETKTKTGLRTYSCPLPLHDDRVLSLCFALEAIGSNKGKYIIR